MGARVVGRGKARADPRRETRTIALIIAAVVGPCLLTYFLIAADMRSDLSELRPRQVAWNNGATLVSWTILAADEGYSHSRHPVELPSGRVRMLGYMMDGYRPVSDGTLVRMFVLMPEAGQFLHPAHRIPDEMVEVWLKGGKSIPYTDRRMVWVEGVLREVHGFGASGTAAYSLTDALVEQAEDRDISKWFLP